MEMAIKERDVQYARKKEDIEIRNREFTELEASNKKYDKEIIKEQELKENINKEAESGAGIGCAQVVFEEKASVVISGKVGPKAYEVLQHAGVDVFLAPPGITVETAVGKYEQGLLQKMEIRKF